MTSFSWLLLTYFDAQWCFRAAAHVQFGTAESINAAYMHVLRLVNGIPRLFRRHHARTAALFTAGENAAVSCSVELHAGDDMRAKVDSSHCCLIIRLQDWSKVTGGRARTYIGEYTAIVRQKRNISVGAASPLLSPFKRPPTVSHKTLEIKLGCNCLGIYICVCLCLFKRF